MLFFHILLFFVRSQEQIGVGQSSRMNKQVRAAGIQKADLRRACEEATLIYSGNHKGHSTEFNYLCRLQLTSLLLKLILDCVE